MGMAKCTECLHWDACLYLFKIVLDREPNLKGSRAEEKCPNFKYRTEYEKVVRCKDCKNFIQPTESDGTYGHCDLEGETMIIWRACDFCSSGERREDNV